MNLSPSKQSVLMIGMGLALSACSVMQTSQPKAGFEKKNETLIFTGKPYTPDERKFTAFIADQTFSLASLRGNLGGYNQYYLHMGQQLRKMNLRVSVDGLYTQGCANYLFLAGKAKERTLGGVLGFTYGFSSFDDAEIVKEIEKSGFSPKWGAVYLENFRKSRVQELAYLNDVGVKRDLFDDARRMVLAYEKQQNILNIPGVNRIFWVPTSPELGCYGVTDLTDDFSLKPEEQKNLLDSGISVFATKDLKVKPEAVTPCVK
jgi:hypothetical protein